MTLQKKLKKAVRARSQKTGESYTAARRNLLLARDKKAGVTKPSEAPVAAPAPSLAVAAPAPPPPAATPAAKPTRGEVSDASARKKTGHGLDHWFAVLDAFGAATKGHTAAAAHLYNDHGVPGWHSQGITVAYERARGLRDMHQSCAGDFQVSVSKTVPATVAEVVEALENAARRAVWLNGADPGLAGAVEAAFSGDKPKEVKTKGDDFARLRFPWDANRVEISVTGKPKGASVTAASTKLSGPEEVELRRAQWRAALEGLRRHLGG